MTKIIFRCQIIDSLSKLFFQLLIAPFQYECISEEYDDVHGAHVDIVGDGNGNEIIYMKLENRLETF